jgi:hypothetical protein
MTLENKQRRFQDRLGNRVVERLRTLANHRMAQSVHLIEQVHLQDPSPWSKSYALARSRSASLVALPRIGKSLRGGDGSAMKKFQSGSLSDCFL